MTTSSHALLSEKRTLCFAPDISDQLQAVHLTPEQGYILSRIDGKLTPRDILAVTPLDEEETARALVGLIASGLVHLHSAPQTNGGGSAATKPGGAKPTGDSLLREKRKEIERLHELWDRQSPAEVLGLGQQATIEEIKQAFREKIFRFHPDRYPGLDDPSFRQKLSHLVAVATDAFNTLSEKATIKPAPGQNATNGGPRLQTTKKDTEPEAYDAQQHAFELFQHAQRAYDTQDYWQVVQLCRQAVEIQADKGEYHFLLGRALLKNKNWRKEAGASLRKAAELDPTNPEYLAYLGALYQSEGLGTRASKVLQQVKAIDPDYEIPVLA
jgi:hypothetical protein